MIERYWASAVDITEVPPGVDRSLTLVAWYGRERFSLRVPRRAAHA